MSRWSGKYETKLGRLAAALFLAEGQKPGTVLYGLTERAKDHPLEAACVKCGAPGTITIRQVVDKAVPTCACGGKMKRHSKEKA